MKSNAIKHGGPDCVGGSLHKQIFHFDTTRQADTAHRLSHYGEKLSSHLDKGVRFALIQLFAMRFAHFRYGLSDIAGYAQRGKSPYSSAEIKKKNGRNRTREIELRPFIIDKIDAAVFEKVGIDSESL